MLRLPARVSQLVALAGGTLSGDDVTVAAFTDRAAGARGPDALALFDDRAWLPRLRRGLYAAVLTRAALATEARALAPTLWLHATPREALATVLRALAPAAPPGAHPTAVVHPGATVDATAAIEALAYVGDGATVGARTRVGVGAVIDAGARVGEDTVVGARAVVGAGCVVGARCVVDAGAVLGARGFGFLPPDGAGVAPWMPHVGGVVIEDDVFVGALATVAAGTLSPTRVRRGARIDAHVHVAHNCDVGESAVLVGQVGLAGSVVVGAGAQLGGQVGVADHREIGAGARIAAGSGVISDVPAGETWGGYPARPHATWLRAMARLYRGLRG